MTAALQPALEYPPRPTWLPLPFIPPVLLAGASWLSGGSQGLTDLAFVTLTGACAFGLLIELRDFSRRFGVGGVALFAGVLVWFCHDYLRRWLGFDPHAGAVIDAAPTVEITPLVLAKAAFFHGLFVLLAVVGLLIPGGGWLRRIARALPEPAPPRVLYIVVALGTALGVAPFFLLASEPWHEAIWLALTQGRTGDGPTWLVGRSGNLNYRWGAYLHHLLDIGRVSGILAAVAALLVARAATARAALWCVWLFWLAVAFGSGTRGNVVFMALPVVVLLFIREHARADPDRFRLRPYLAPAALALLVLLLIQTQASYRDESFREVDLSRVDLIDLQGNAMFTEGLPGYALIPERHPFAYDRFPGEAILRPIPQTLFNFVIGPIPRALWRDKPIDPLFSWWSAVNTGEEFQGEEQAGTTVATGLVGYWYFRFGLAGVVQGGALFGWLCAAAERCLQQARGGLMPLLLSLGLTAWLARSFRDINFADLYPMLLGIAALAAAAFAMKGGQKRG